MDLTTFPVLCTRSCCTGELFLLRLAVVKSEPSREIICKEESDGRWSCYKRVSPCSDGVFL